MPKKLNLKRNRDEDENMAPPAKKASAVILTRSKSNIVPSKIAKSQNLKRSSSYEISTTDWSKLGKNSKKKFVGDENKDPEISSQSSSESIESSSTPTTQVPQASDLKNYYENFWKELLDEEEVPLVPMDSMEDSEGEETSRVSLKCPDCEKTFNQKWKLDAHFRVHSGLKPYACSFKGCTKSFADRSNLRAHQRSKNHHSWEYICPVCTKPFGKISYFSRHSDTACEKYLKEVEKKTPKLANMPII